MSENKSKWGGFLRNYFKNTIHTKNPSEKKVSTNFNEFEKTFYKKQEVVAEEPVIPNEKYQQEVELAKQYLPEVNEPIVEESVVEEVKVEQPVEQTTVDDVITPEELEEFARLNGITDVKASLSEDGKTLEIEGNVRATPKVESIDTVVIVERPTETKVKSVKISKNDAKKDSNKEEKVEKSTKSPKAPKKPTKPKSKK